MFNGLLVYWFTALQVSWFIALLIYWFTVCPGADCSALLYSVLLSRSPLHGTFIWNAAPYFYLECCPVLLSGIRPPQIGPETRI